MSDTRSKIFLLLDYKEYYGIDKSLSDAEYLIKDIPSVTLLHYIAEFGVNLYLHENSEYTGKTQFMLVDKLLGKCAKVIQKKWVDEVKKQEEIRQSPIMFWTYSNLLFYGLIFKTINNSPLRDLTSEEAIKVFDAYLIINGIANSKIQIEPEIIKKADEEDKIEDVILPSFIYQKDYASTVDFSNQVTRGVTFFKYLENDTKYKTVVKEYYSSKKVSGHLRMFKNLMVILSEINLGNGLERRNQLANLQDYNISNEVDLDYIETLCINSEVLGYNEDISFGSLREKFLYRLNKFQFLILDVNFLIDQFYKAQVFSFNAFLKSKKIKGDFLAEKGKFFAENIYLPLVLDRCFSHYIRFYGDSCMNSNDDELCDAYLREENKICLIEFKDVLLNASIKNSAKKESLFAEFNKKFVANQTGKPKGITQLLNAVKDIETNSISFDNSIPKGKIKIYPVIVYTDLSFGAEGINKIFKDRFKNEIIKISLKNIIVKDVAFINLNFFEIREDYFMKKKLDLFKMLDGYMEHLMNSDYSMIPFEVFSRFYMNTHVPEDLGATSSYLEHQHNILNAK